MRPRRSRRSRWPRRRRRQRHRRGRARLNVEVSACLAMLHPVADVRPDEVAAHLPGQRAAMMRVLSHAMPPAAKEEPYSGQECIGLGEAWRALHALVQGTVRDHEGNSCLVVGESGCGKSLVCIYNSFRWSSPSFVRCVASVPHVVRQRRGSYRSLHSYIPRTANVSRP